MVNPSSWEEDPDEDWAFVTVTGPTSSLANKLTATIESASHLVATSLAGKLNATNPSASHFAAASLANEPNATNTSASLLTAASFANKLTAANNSASLFAAAPLANKFIASNSSAPHLAAASPANKLNAAHASVSHLAAGVNAAAGALTAGVFGRPFNAAGTIFGWFLGVALLVACCRCWRQCKLRDVVCLRWCMRCTGWDSFEEFDCMFIVHTADVACIQGGNVEFEVRFTAGRHSVHTSQHKTRSHHEIQEPLNLFIEQGVDTVVVDLVKGTFVIASLHLDAKDIYAGVLVARQTTFSMRLKASGFINPRVKLSIVVSREIFVDAGAAAWPGTATRSDRPPAGRGSVSPVGQQITPLLRAHLVSAGVDVCSPSEAQLAAIRCACCGPLEYFGSWGTKRLMYFGVQKTHRGRFVFGLWKNSSAFHHGSAPRHEVNVMHVRSVSMLGDSDGFVLHYADRRGRRLFWNLRRTERNRDIWVEHISLVVSLFRDRVLKRPAASGGPLGRASAPQVGRRSAATSDSLARAASDSPPASRRTTAG